MAIFNQEGQTVNFQQNSTFNSIPKVYKTENWHEDMGNCLFFHFDTFEEPPEVMCGSPLDSIFMESFWTHFIEFDFIPIFEQAIKLNEN